MFGLGRKRSAPDAFAPSDPKGLLAPDAVLPKPRYQITSAEVPATCIAQSADAVKWYPPSMIGAHALGRRFVQPGSGYVTKARKLLARLSQDDYSRYLIEFYDEGLKRFGEDWGYADIVTVLIGLTETLRPRSYLEVGVRRGRSACAVCSAASGAGFTLFDLWLKDYAGMGNPGPEFVQSELAGLGHSGPIEFVDGNSHQTLPRFFRTRPDYTADIVTIDGDHTTFGAAQDIADALPRVSIGGAIVFDDIAHPKHPGLRDVWKRLVVDDPRFSAWSYSDAGYGVGFAIRRW